MRTKARGTGTIEQRPGRVAWREASVMTFSLLCFMACGCAKGPTFEFDELDLVAVEEELSEFPLGHYSIPIPVTDRRLEGRLASRNRLQLDFALFALISPQNKWHLEDAWARHEGKIRDRVIRICRNASLDELQEPELETLKARLMDAIGPQLGGKARQLLITEVVSQQI